MLFNEPKLLKSITPPPDGDDLSCFSALQRAEIAEIEPAGWRLVVCDEVSVLFNEPKLLKSLDPSDAEPYVASFSALQRAEIAEINHAVIFRFSSLGFSALQRAEIAEIARGGDRATCVVKFQCSSTSRNC